MNNLRSVVVLYLLSVLLVDSANAQWIQTSGPYGGTVTCFAVSSNGAGGTNLFAGLLNTGVYRSTNTGDSWAPVNNGLPDANFITFAVSGTNLIAGTSGGIFLSTNNGTSWTSVDSGLTYHPAGPFRPVGAFAVSGKTVFAGTGSHIDSLGGDVLISTNNGTSWSVVSTGLAGTWIHDLAVIGTKLFAGTSYGYFAEGRGVFLSTDNGVNWASVNVGLIDPVFSDPGITALAVNGTNLFAGIQFFDRVFRSTNNGASWDSASTGLPNTPGVSVLAFAVSGANLFAGTSGNGVFLSTNNGTSWTAVNTGLTDTNVYVLATNGTNLFAGTGSGVWRRPLSEFVTSVGRISADMPARFTLEQNYPNPFNPTTTIRYALPQRASVSLIVYNTLGQQVAVLQNGELEAGYHEVKFDGSNLASGIYFYRIQAGGFIQAKKFVLLR